MKVLFTALLLPLIFINTAHADLSVGLAKKYARVVYDVSLNGGQSVSHDLGATIPAGSFVTDAFVYINTAFTDSGTGSVSISCGGTRNIMDWRDLTSEAPDAVFSTKTAQTNYNASYFIPFSLASAAAGNSSIASACNVTVSVRSDSGYVPLTAGKMTVFMEYFNQ